MDPAMDGGLWSGILQRDATGWLAKSHGQKVAVDLPSNSERMVMIYDAKLAFGANRQLVFEEKTKIVYIPEDHMVNYRMVKEVCAGIGGISQGLHHAGYETIAFFDCNPLACEVMEMNYHAPVICGNLLCSQDRYLLHITPMASRCVVACGFPCQPLSVQGDLKGEMDNRSAPFYYALKLFWEQQGSALLMECVLNALKAAYVQKALQQLSHSMGMEFHQRILSLERTWVCRRTRWWMLMIPKKYHMDRMVDLPWDDSFQKVEDLIQVWTSWGNASQDLMVLPDELQMMHDPNLGDDIRRLRQSSKCPCILHSYGTFNRPCPCGCRTSPFNICRPETGGLRGFYVIDEQEGTPRFLHAKEAAIFCSLTPAMRFKDEGRTCLCLVGQCAAPIQSLWMGLYLRQVVEGRDMAMDYVLKTYKMKLLRDMYGAWPLQSPLVVHLWDEQEGHEVQIKASCRPMVQEILQAEKRLQDQGQWLEIRDGAGRLPAEYMAGPSSIFGDLRIERHQKKQRRLNTSDRCVQNVFIWQQDDFDIVQVTVQAGCYIFEIFAVINIMVALENIKDVDGNVWRADDRIWHSTTFVGYAIRNYVAYGKSMSQFQWNTWMKYGLTDVCLDEMALFMKRYSAGAVEWYSAQKGTSLFKGLEQKDCNGRLMEDLLDVLHQGEVWTAVVIDGHWILLCLVVQEKIISIASWNGEGDDYVHEVRLLATEIKEKMGLQGHILTFERIYDQKFPFTCGTVALLHLGDVWGIWKKWLGAPDELRWHYQLLKLYGNYGVNIGAGRAQPSNDQDMVWKLRDILSGHGVPEERTEERALAGLKKLGHHLIEQALGSNNPWHALKQAGSQPGSQFLWVKPDELDKQIRARAQSKFGVSRSDKKPGNRPKKSPVVIDPTQLQLIPDMFVDENGHEVRQIEMRKVASDRAGVAFGTIQDVAPFVAEGKPLTMDALGVLTTLPIPVHQQGLLPVQNLRYPAVYIPTGEPILIEGSLVQLGDLFVQRKKDSFEGEPNPIPTKTIKITVYKDEWELDWATFGQAPMKAITTTFPLFILCNGLKCGGQCGKYHAPVDAELDGVILDLWGRSWQSLRGGRVQQKDSEQFQALLRIPSICWPSLHALSGSQGLYLEPRSPDGRNADEHAAVVWIPQGTLAMAQHRLRTMERVQAVVRHGTKFGIRVSKKDAESAHKKVAPEQKFYNFSVQKVYELRPLPHGTQRAGVQQLLKSWKWVAKPLQPFKSDQLGAGWLVGTEEEPPAQVLPSSKGDITVTIHKKPGQQPNLPVILGTDKTKKHIRQGGQQVHDRQRSNLTHGRPGMIHGLGAKQ